MATNEGYPRKRERTRNQLMRSGMVVLARTGPDGARVAEIADEAGVSTGTFYNHFQSVAELTETICDDLASQVEVLSPVLAAIDHDPAVRIALGTRQMLQMGAEDPAAAAAFVRLLAAVPSFRTRVREVVVTAVSDGVSSGRLQRTDIHIVADACLGATVQWIRSTLAGDTTETMTSRQRERLEIMMSILGLDPAAAKEATDLALSVSDG